MAERLTLDEVRSRYGTHAAARRALGHRHVPTVVELAKEGHARKVSTVRGTSYQLTAQGRERIYAAMRHNAALPALPPEYIHPSRTERPRR